MKSKEKKLFTLTLFFCFNSIILFLAVIFLLLRGNYFSILKQTMNKSDYNYESNASYTQRKTQFEMLPDCDSDIVFAGDSITARFEWQEYFKDKKVLNRGIDSDVSLGLLNRMDTVIASHPKKIFFMIGINDIRQEIPAESTLKNYQNIIDDVKEYLPECQIYIQSVIPVSKSTGIMNSQVSSLNMSLKELAEVNNLTYIDIYSNLISSDNDFTYTVDGVHPTGKGYAIWLDTIKPYIE